MGQKRKFQVSKDESPLQDAKWVQLCDRVFEIKARNLRSGFRSGGIVNFSLLERCDSSGLVPDLQAITLRDPDSFSVGVLHRNVSAWGDILKNHPLVEQVMGWIQNKVDILDFLRPFTGMYKKSTYSSEFPPRKQLANHGSCQRFTEFVSQEILNHLLTGAFRIWGAVGVDDPPYLVLPLMVEPTKPRLCLDVRFLNLWMKDMPFSLDKLTNVPQYVYKSSYMTKCDDKSGYDHVLLSENSQAYFGFSSEGFVVCMHHTTIWLEDLAIQL